MRIADVAALRHRLRRQTPPWWAGRRVVRRRLTSPRGADVAVLLGLAAAVAYGVSDFIAGLLSRRHSFVLVTVVGHTVGSVVVAIALLLTARTMPTAHAVWWGAASGVGSVVGTLALYRGLGRGRMGVVAPLSALCAAVIPVLVGVLTGERPTPSAWTGVALAFPAIWLVSSPDANAWEPVTHNSAATEDPPAGPQPRLATGVGDGLLAGLGFALLFVALHRAGAGSGLWPVGAGHLTALALLLPLAANHLRRSSRRELSLRLVAGAATVGLSGTTATVLYFLSTHAGLLAIVAVVTSLYPGVTVVLAALVLRERIGVTQGVGLALATVAVILVVVG
jgi:drug/metabolite transporter (DMT)-like permease